MDKKKGIPDKYKASENDTEDSESGGSGDGGKGGSSGGAGGVWIPNYYELLGVTADEKELTGLAAQALFEQRISVKSQGIEVTALSKIQKIRNKLQDPNLSISNDGGGGADLEAHPELAEQGGDIDPNLIVLPESEAAERASNDPKLQNKLRNRLAAKFGMSADISMQSMKEEYSKKLRMQAQPTPEVPRPRYRPSGSPRLTP